MPAAVAAQQENEDRGGRAECGRGAEVAAVAQFGRESSADVASRLPMLRQRGERDAPADRRRCSTNQCLMWYTTYVLLANSTGSLSAGSR